MSNMSPLDMLTAVLNVINPMIAIAAAIFAAKEFKAQSALRM